MKTNYIKPIEKKLNEKMHKICSIFCVIGTNFETPRYYNFGEYENGRLRIQSTQNKNLFFDIKTDFKFINVADFWQQFKEYRTKFLLENYPTINTK